MSNYKVSFQITEQELEILHDALYTYSRQQLDSDTGAYVAEDVEKFYDKISGLYLEESTYDPAMEAFVEQYGVNAVLEEPEKLEKFRESFKC
jgi:predicted glycosyl hydrolase (DUF1957 family)